MSRFADYVTALSGFLAATLTDYSFNPGSPPDTLPPASTATAYVWVTETVPDPANQLVAEISAMVRLFPVQAERFDGLTPIDPAPLYDAAEVLEQTIATNSVPGGSGPWFMACRQVGFDHDAQFVDALIVGTTWNDAAVS